MTILAKILNKYIILLIVKSLFGVPWLYLVNVVTAGTNHDLFQTLNSIPTYVDCAIRLITILFLFIDFKKYKIKFIALAIIAALFFPLLGMVIFALLYLENRKEKASA